MYKCISLLNKARSGSGGVGINVRPRSKISCSGLEIWRAKRLVTLEREVDGGSVAPGGPNINPIG